MTTYYRAHEPQHPPRLLHSLPRRHETTKKAMIFVRSSCLRDFVVAFLVGALRGLRACPVSQTRSWGSNRPLRPLRSSEAFLSSESSDQRDAQRPRRARRDVRVAVRVEVIPFVEHVLQVRLDP